MGGTAGLVTRAVTMAAVVTGSAINPGDEDFACQDLTTTTSVVANSAGTNVVTYSATVIVVAYSAVATHCGR
jgi:hypothetical protein